MANQKLENIHTIVVHCSATKEGQDISASDIDYWHRNNGWSGIGYHKVIRLNGAVENGRPFFQTGAHVAGNNTNTIGICLIGGLDSAGKPKNTFTTEQMNSLYNELVNLTLLCPNLKEIKGHRDFSPDLNGDGQITKDEWIKDCPCFDVKDWIDTSGYASLWNLI